MQLRRFEEGADSIDGGINAAVEGGAAVDTADVDAMLLRHRKAVAAWLTPSDSQSRKVFATLARLWHIPVMLYLAGLFVIVLIRPGGVLFPVLEATAEVLAAIVVGMIVNHTLATWARRGVSLPDRITASLPLLEQRLNSFLESWPFRHTSAVLALLGL